MVKSNSKSYTLIEILVVAAIVVVLSGTSLAIFSTYRDDKVLGNQVTLLTNVLELAKNKATSGDVSLCGNSPTPYVDNYTVTVDDTNLTLHPGCTSTSPTPITYPIPTNIIVPTFSLRFDGQNYQGGTRRFPIKNTVTGKCKFVQIDETGVVTNGDMECP